MIKKIKNKNASSNGGFSLVEVSIAIGVLGILTLGVMQLSKIISDVQVRATSNLDILTLKHEIMELVKNGKHCSVSLAGNDPVGSPVIFNKTNIDDLNTEGMNIELWTSDAAGLLRDVKQFSATDPSAKTHGNVEITRLQLVMNNATIPPSTNYPAGSFSDTGMIKLEIQKKGGGNRILRSTIPVSVGFTTDGSGNSAIEYCSSTLDTGKFKFLVMHSQTSVIPTCPAGWASESVGYSYVLSVIHEGALHFEDLGDTGSCLTRFGGTPFIECENNLCDYHTANDYSMWLWTGIGTSPARCNVCRKKGAVIKVLHSQTTTIPTCPIGMSQLWNGYSLIILSNNESTSAPMRLSSPGSCLRSVKLGVPFVQCNIGGCSYATGQDYGVFLTSRVGSPDTGIESPIVMSAFSRCAVCELD
jgi:prepilin-type N-terminal cleavage/methylation domain-containing protein